MGRMKELSIQKDNADLSAGAQDFADKITEARRKRQAALSQAHGCPACEFLLQICEDGKIVCKVCGRDDHKAEMGASTIIRKLGGNDLTLLEGESDE